MRKEKYKTHFPSLGQNGKIQLGLDRFLLNLGKITLIFYGSAKLNSIVKEALDFADDLFEELADHVISGDLESLFKPLENSEKDQIYELQKLKVKGEERKSYLRLYAVRFRDEFVITGGTVKLTRFMKDRPHTKLEIIRLEAAVEFLRQNDIEGKVVYIEK